MLLCDAAKLPSLFIGVRNQREIKPETNMFCPQITPINAELKGMFVISDEL